MTPEGANFNATPSNVGLTTGLCTMNCTNIYNIYSFHNGGSNMLFGDGSVSFISQNISWLQLAVLFTATHGDVVGFHY